MAQRRDIPDGAVIISSRGVTCAACGEALRRQTMVVVGDGGQRTCLPCAGLDALVLLPSGDAALTRRATKHSATTAPLVEWNARRRRYERRGLLVEPEAKARAERECSADATDRAQRRARDAVRRERLDEEYRARFGDAILAAYPGCPPERAAVIAEHACEKHSGRVGRTASAKDLDEDKVRLAVTAHIRHTETPYDELLDRGLAKVLARSEVLPRVREVLARWRGGLQ